MWELGGGFDPRVRGGEEDLNMLRTGLTIGLALGVQAGTNTRGKVVFGENSDGWSIGFRGWFEIGFWEVGFGV